MAIKTWQDAKNKSLTQKALQELCAYDLKLEETIKSRLRVKHPNASERQINNWAYNAIEAKMQREHWGYANIDLVRV